MGLFDITDLVLERGLAGAGLRQQALSNNVANANTAGYKRSDVDFQSSLAQAIASDDVHTAVERLAFAPQTDRTSTMRADGNNVDVDQEMSSLTENAVTYEALLSIHRARVGMLRMALGGGGA
jgi:flagellar basal-body rod protein FlgB